MDEAIRQQLISEHLEKHPQDRDYVEHLLENQEFVPSDKAYAGWFRFNLHGIERGEALIKRIEKQVGPISGLDVLDIGAGGGGNSIAFSNHGCNVTAIEIDENRLGWLRARIKDHDLPIDVIPDPIEDVEFDKKFDLIICNAVLEHVNDWRSFLDHRSEDNTLSVVVNVLDLYVRIIEGRARQPDLVSALMEHDACIVCRDDNDAITLLNRSKGDPRNHRWFLKVYPVSWWRDSIWWFDRNVPHPGRLLVASSKATRYAVRCMWRLCVSGYRSGS